MSGVNPGEPNGYQFLGSLDPTIAQTLSSTPGSSWSDGKYTYYGLFNPFGSEGGDSGQDPSGQPSQAAQIDAILNSQYGHQGAGDVLGAYDTSGKYQGYAPIGNGDSGGFLGDLGSFLGDAAPFILGAGALALTGGALAPELFGADALGAGVSDAALSAAGGAAADGGLDMGALSALGDAGGSGAFLGEGAASGIPAWDAAGGVDAALSGEGGGLSQAAVDEMFRGPADAAASSGGSSFFSNPMNDLRLFNTANNLLGSGARQPSRGGGSYYGSAAPVGPYGAATPGEATLADNFIHQSLTPPSRLYSGPGAIQPASATPPSSIQPGHTYAHGGQVTEEGAHGALTLAAGGAGGQDDVVPANLAPGEYVFDADTVAALGDGNNQEGARKLDEWRAALRTHKRSAPADKIPPRAKPVEAYLPRK